MWHRGVAMQLWGAGARVFKLFSALFGTAQSL